MSGNRIFTIFALTLVATACSTAQIPASTSIDPNSASLIGDGWVEVVPGGYEKLSAWGSERQATSLEGHQWLLATARKSLDKTLSMKSQNMPSQKMIDSQKNFISFLEISVKYFETNGSLKVQAGTCTLGATAAPLTSGDGAKADARTNCTGPYQQASSAVVDAGGRHSDVTDYQPGERYSSSASTQLFGPSNCSSYASAGVVGINSKDSTNSACHF